MTPTPKVGRLLKKTRYATHKYRDDKGFDVRKEHYAPVGTEVLWLQGTNSGNELSYGGIHLYFVEIVGYGPKGLQLGVDFEWVADDSQS